MHPIWSTLRYLLVKKEQRDSNLKGQAPKLVEALTEVDNAICISAHEIDHLQFRSGQYHK